MNTTNQPNGVFQEQIGKQAFIDVLSTAITGLRRARIGPEVSLGPSVAIGGAGRAYARSRRGVCVDSENPLEWRYGPNPLFRHLPRYNVRFRSNTRPLTAAEVKGVLSALFCRGFRARPLLAEVTFDLANTSVADLRAQLLSSLRSEREVSAGGTYYVGAPKSPSEIRIYQKAPAITRLEVILRVGFFRKHNILRLEDLSQLRAFDFSRTLRFCQRKDRFSLAAELRSLPDGNAKRLLLKWPTGCPLRLWVSTLRSAGIDPERCLTDSPIQKQIERMQRALIW